MSNPISSTTDTASLFNETFSHDEQLQVTTDNAASTAANSAEFQQAINEALIVSLVQQKILWDQIDPAGIQQIFRELTET